MLNHQVTACCPLLARETAAQPCRTPGRAAGGPMSPPHPEQPPLPGDPVGPRRPAAKLHLPPAQGFGKRSSPSKSPAPGLVLGAATPVALADETRHGRHAPVKGTVQPVPLERPQPDIGNQGDDVRVSSGAAGVGCHGSVRWDSRASSVAGGLSSAPTLPSALPAPHCPGPGATRGVRDPAGGTHRDTRLLRPGAIRPCPQPSRPPPARGCSS